jgi:hypothetical protein
VLEKKLVVADTQLIFWHSGQSFFNVLATASPGYFATRIAVGW